MHRYCATGHSRIVCKVILLKPKSSNCKFCGGAGFTCSVFTRIEIHADFFFVVVVDEMEVEMDFDLKNRLLQF